MQLKSALRYLLLPPGLFAVAEVLRFAAISLDQAFQVGFGEGLMMAWILFFIVGLPMLLLGLWAAGEIGRHRLHRRTIPHAGVKIP